MELTRRTLLRAGGLAIATTPLFWKQPASAGAPVVEQLHLTFGADAAREMTVSWATAGAVRNPRVRLGTPRGGHGSTFAARTAATSTTPQADGSSPITRPCPI